MLAVYWVIYGSSLLRNMERKMQHLNILKEKLLDIGAAEAGAIEISLQRGGYFVCAPVIDNGFLKGVNVSNLGNSPFLPIDVFAAVLSLLALSPNYTARRGNAMGGMLGTDEIPLNSVEGHVAHVIYGIDIGEGYAFQRISPIAGILRWAGLILPPPTPNVLTLAIPPIQI